MTKLWLTLKLGLLSTCTFAQFAIESNFNAVHIGRNQSLLLNYNFEKIQIGVGIKYNINKLTNFPQGYFYKKTFYATSPSEHIGVELNFKYQLFSREFFEMSLFYNGQYTKSQIRFEDHFAIAQLSENPTSEEDYIYVKHIDLIGPAQAFENNIGVAINIFLTKNIYLSQKFGLGMVFINIQDPNTTILGAGNWDFSEILSFGLGWKFNKKTQLGN